MIELTDNSRNWHSMEFTSDVEPTYIACKRSLKWAPRLEVGDVIPVARWTKDGKTRLWKVQMLVKAMKVRADSVSVVLVYAGEYVGETV